MALVNMAFALRVYTSLKWPVTLVFLYRLSTFYGRDAKKSIVGGGGWLLIVTGECGAELFSYSYS